jgi:hypothetical protein
MGRFERGEELAGIADSGEGQTILVSELRGIARHEPRQVNRLCRSRGHPDHRIGAIALAHHDERIGMANLIDHRRAHRACGKHLTIANSPAGIDHQQRLIENQGGALKAIIHDNQVTPSPTSKLGALDSSAETAVGFLCEQHRFIANQPGGVPAQIDKLGVAHAAAIPPGEKTGLEATRNRRIGERQRRGVLPDPPTVKLPTQITAASTAVRTLFSMMRRATRP